MVSTAGVGSGTVMLDDQAERLAYFAAFYVSTERAKIMPVASMMPSLVDNCDGSKSGSGCYRIVSSFLPRLSLTSEIVYHFTLSSLVE